MLLLMTLHRDHARRFRLPDNRFVRQPLIEARKERVESRPRFAARQTYDLASTRRNNAALERAKRLVRVRKFLLEKAIRQLERVLGDASHD